MHTKFASAACLFVVLTVSAAAESGNRYRHLTVGFDWGSIATQDVPSGKTLFFADTKLRNQFNLLRIGYYSHRGGGRILGYGYQVNLGIALSGNLSVVKGPNSAFRPRTDPLTGRPEPTLNSYSYGFGRQIHVGQFFGASFKIIDAGSIRWFAAVGISMDIIVGLPASQDLIRSTAAFGPQVNSYFTYMFNPSLGLSAGGNFTYYFLDLVSAIGGRTTEGPSGGFGVFLTFVR